MAKALRTAAIVVGAAALIATGVGAAASLGFIGAAAGSAAAAAGATTAAAIAATAASVATIAGAVGAGLSLAAGLSTPKGTVGGNPTKFKIDKDSGIPIVFGRTYVGGNVLHRQYYNDPGSRMKNQRESWVTALSLGPVKSIGPLLIDKSAVAFSPSGAALGSFAGNMWLDTQLGACPETRALRGPTGNFPGWDAQSKLSGIAADLWTLDFDSKGEKFPNGVPDRGRVVEGVFGYDPRRDSTYPGGVGPCRINDPATHVYSENPWVCALTFAHGFHQNGHLVAGGDLPITGIDVNAFVQAANTADANGWRAGGVVYTTADNDWDILKMLAQAGGGEVFPVGGLLSCTHAAPRVSIGTITSADIIGDVVAPSTAKRRVRRNTIIPRVRLESQGWEVVPIKPVSVPAYVALDRASRPRETEYPLIQQENQAAQIAMYEMLDARELEAIVLPCKLPAIGYRPGDCVTLDIPEANLVGRDVVLRDRELDMATYGVTFSARSETAGKHPFALGASTAAPRTPDLTVPGLDLDAPVGWSAVATMVPSPSVPMPAIVVSGLVDNAGAEAVQFDYRPLGSDGWLTGGTAGVDATRIEIATVVAEASYEVSVRYRVRGTLGKRLVLGPVTIPQQSIAVDYDDITGPNKPEPGADKTGNHTSKDTAAVGGRPSADITRLIDLNGVNVLTEILRGDALAAFVDARTMLDGKPVGTVLTTLSTRVETQAESVAQTFDILGGKNAAGTGWIFRGGSVIASADGLRLTSLDSLEASVNGINADIVDVKEILFDQSGATLRSIDLLDLEGNITGKVNTLTGERSDYAIYANVFRIVNPNGGQPFTPFQIGEDGTVEMISVRVKTLAYEALVPLFGGANNKLDPTYGYQRMPGGLIRQWGKVRQRIVNEVALSVVFPIAFPTACVASGSHSYISVQSTSKDMWMHNLGEPSVNGATFATQAATRNAKEIDGYDWWAEGY